MIAFFTFHLISGGKNGSIDNGEFKDIPQDAGYISCTATIYAPLIKIKIERELRVIGMFISLIDECIYWFIDFRFIYLFI